MNLIGPTPLAGAKDDGLIDAFDPGSPPHALFYSFVSFNVDLVIAFYEEILVKLEPYIVAIHHQYEVLVVLRP